jgi:hypothetical protein
MKNSYRHYRALIISLLLTAALTAITGCSNKPDAAETAQPEEPPRAGTADVQLPTIPNVPTATSLPGDEPTDDDALGGLSGYEILAANAGKVLYSGYSCVITSVGCSCERPVAERVSFVFNENETMLYQFEGSGYAAEWEMTRAGRNQWSYELPMFDDTGEFQGRLFVLITFTETGYIYTLVGELSGEWKYCPDVTFRRLMSSTPEPE